MPVVTTSLKIFDNFDMTSDGYSTTFDLEGVSGYTIHAFWDGPAEGSFFIQISSEPTATNWVVIENSIIDITGADSVHIWKHALASYRWVRLGWAYSTGTGTLNAYIKCKGLT